MNIYIILLFCICTIFPLVHLFHCLPLFRRSGENIQQQSMMEKGISILVPCYNEQSIIETSIASMKSLPYADFEVIYINDGSSDETLFLLKKLLQLVPCHKVPDGKLFYKDIKTFYQSELYPNIYVIDKENGGKADSLNAGIEYANHDIVITLDADSILANQSLPLINQVFEDENVIAAGGMVHVLQTKIMDGTNRLSLLTSNILVRVQMLDFLKSFYILKTSLARFRALSIISGAFGIFTKQVLLEVGGYRSTLGEDIDITLRMQKYISKHKHKKVVFVPEAVCYTECPENWHDLFKQRVRWQKAFIDCLIHFRSFFFQTLFTKSVSFFFMFEAFLTGTVMAYVMTGELIKNVVEGQYSLTHYILAYLVSVLLFGILYDVAAIFMCKYYGFTFQGRDKYRLVSTIFFDILVYRFVTMFFVMYGTISYFFNKHDWNKVTRTGRKYEVGSKSAA
ncbi:glycosyltransferase [Bacillus sp. 3103sda1]|uniref:glycosyltransferase family 2 protein n=1 Tax=Bacillus sp. 3103sda1 TaxID=2953808 RepID=UPI0020A107A6|nr:glycosyltransferase [Bacillus sp. 3103sda1]MCP1125932.1 glycosyltransferase [Bacillus sp. 3103sda1]